MFCALVFYGLLLALAAPFDVNGDMGDSMDGLAVDEANEPDVPLIDILPGDTSLLDLYDIINLGDAGLAQRKKRTTAIKNQARRWPNGTIPYKFDWSYFTPSQIDIIKQSMQRWQEITCLTFRYAKPSDDNKLHFKKGSPGICTSYVGMQGGVQAIKLVKGCFRYPGLIVHEIGHAIGLQHEHIRPDRDDYLIYHPENVKDGMKYNFKKLGINQILNTDLRYDYRSIMHYGRKAFSKNGQYTLETIDPSFQTVIGQRKVITDLDKETVNLMYNCEQDK